MLQMLGLALAVAIGALGAGAAKAEGCASAQGCARIASTGLAVSARKRAVRRTHRRRVHATPSYAPAAAYPNRPAWASPYECYTDDGNGLFRSCTNGGPSQ